MGLWQMALQKLGCSCHTQNPAPATTIMAATTPATIHPRLGRFLGAGPPAAPFSSSMLMIVSSLPYLC